MECLDPCHIPGVIPAEAGIHAVKGPPALVCMEGLQHGSRPSPG